jgi:hypothetical protein
MMAQLSTAKWCALSVHPVIGPGFAYFAVSLAKNPVRSRLQFASRYVAIAKWCGAFEALHHLMEAATRPLGTGHAVIKAGWITV